MDYNNQQIRELMAEAWDQGVLATNPFHQEALNRDNRDFLERWVFPANPYRGEETL